MNKTSKIIAGGVLAVILIIAAIMNPSAAESRQMIMDIAVEEIIKRLPATMDGDGEDEPGQTATVLDFISSLTTIKTTDIDVTDYVVFSTFGVSVIKSDGKHELASGLILFGNVIMLSVDVPDDI